VLRKHSIRLDVMLSLDGVGEIHDLVRGRPKNFSNALQVLEEIRQHRVCDSHQLACTIIKANVFGLHDVLDFAIENESHIKFRLGIPHRRLYTTDVRAPFSLDAAERYHIVQFLHGLIREYESSPQQIETYESLIGQLAHGLPRRSGCNWQHRGATITARGELAYCAVQSDVIGNPVETPSSTLYFGNADYLRNIIHNHCDNCSHDYGGSPRGKFYVKRIARELLARSGAARGLLSVDGRLAPLISQIAAVKYFAVRGARRRAGASAALPAMGAGAATRVVLTGWYGKETLGDKAILAGIVEVIRARIPNVEFVLAHCDEGVVANTIAQFSVFKNIRVVSHAEVPAEIADAALIVFAGGPIMGVNQLHAVEAAFAEAARRGVPRLIAGCGLGPLGHWAHKRSIRNILKLASLRIFRDIASRKLAERLSGVRDTDVVADDPSLVWLEAVRAAHGTPIHRSETLVLSLRDWPGHQYGRELSVARRAMIKERFAGSLTKALEMLAAQQPTLRFVPVPMCTNHYGGDDRFYIRRLLRSAPGLRERCDMSFLSGEVAPERIARAFMEARAALAMRFHSFIFAVGLGTPAVALDYTLGHGKLASAAARYGAVALNIENIEPSALTDAVLSAIEQGSSTATPSSEFRKSMDEALRALNLTA
jgi:polysaccharide pyruvyl transferase WcaK-like protein